MAVVNPPNVVFILADQHRWDFLGGERNGVTLTPNLDRLAAAGTRFRAAYRTTLQQMQEQLLIRLNENTQTQQFLSRGEYRPLRVKRTYPGES
jgi:hypothetical protein